MKGGDLVRIAAKAAIPAWLLFALFLFADGVRGYGFAAGAAIAVGLGLYGVAFGVEALSRAAPAWALRFAAGLGLTGAAAFGLGGAFAQGLPFAAPFGLAETAAQAGFDACVALVTGAALTMAFEAVAARAPDLGAEDA